MYIAVGSEIVVCELRGALQTLRIEWLMLQYRLRLVGTLWYGSDSGKRHTRSLTTTGRVQAEQYRNTNNSKSPGDTRNFHKAPSRVGWWQGNAHVTEQLVRLQRRSEIGDEKLRRGQ
jgi:hypothetical protein